MPQSDRNNGLFHGPRQASNGEVHHGKQTGRRAGTVDRGCLREASHEPRQQATALKAESRVLRLLLLCDWHTLHTAHFVEMLLVYFGKILV